MSSPFQRLHSRPAQAAQRRALVPDRLGVLDDDAPAALMRRRRLPTAMFGWLGQTSLRVFYFFQPATCRSGTPVGGLSSDTLLDTEAARRGGHTPRGWSGRPP